MIKTYEATITVMLDAVDENEANRIARELAQMIKPAPAVLDAWVDGEKLISYPVTVKS